MRIIIVLAVAAVFLSLGGCSRPNQAAFAKSLLSPPPPHPTQARLLKSPKLVAKERRRVIFVKLPSLPTRKPEVPSLPPSSPSTADETEAPPPPSSPSTAGETEAPPPPSSPSTAGETEAPPPPSSPSTAGETEAPPPPSSPSTAGETEAPPPPSSPSTAGETEAPLRRRAVQALRVRQKLRLSIIGTVLCRTRCSRQLRRS